MCLIYVCLYSALIKDIKKEMFTLLYPFQHQAAIHNRKPLLGLTIMTCFYCNRVHGYKQKEFILLVKWGYETTFRSDIWSNVGLISLSVIFNLFTAQPLNLISYSGNMIFTKQQWSFTHSYVASTRVIAVGNSTVYSSGSLWWRLRVLLLRYRPGKMEYFGQNEPIQFPSVLFLDLTGWNGA